MSLLFGTTVVASFLAGAVALFAPCCISVMLPAYFASSFQRRSALVSMTFVYALGVATIILPIAFGAAVLGRLVTAHHTVVFGVAGTAMTALGVLTLVGRGPTLRLPRLRPTRGRGPLTVYGLGAFSGTASACCAPVLAGVAGVAATTSSFLGALLVGVSYVFGMVLPLFAIALLWDGYDWGNSGLLRGRMLTIGFGRRTLRVHSTAALSGALLMGMGAVVVAIAFSGPVMVSHGWQVELSSTLQHWAHEATVWIGRGPAWLASGLILAALGGITWRSMAQAASPASDSDEPPPAAIVGSSASSPGMPARGANIA
ncbi:MAG: cytochrome c biogenesis CcdA family protein [Candidatus Dormibacteria bacterium]